MTTLSKDFVRLVHPRTTGLNKLSALYPGILFLTLNETQMAASFVVNYFLCRRLWLTKSGVTLPGIEMLAGIN
jgi:hypothetical protein